jgi:succinate dehydrogenase/fumarate reductase-like Fe-S protein
MYIWHLKGVKKSKDLVVTLKSINSFLPIPYWAFPKALDELERCGMIKTVRQRGKSPSVTVLCDNCYEECLTLRTQT